MYTVIPTAKFSADVKYYIKVKKYFSIGADIKSITDEMMNGSLPGKEIPGIRVDSDGHTYKVRAANSDTKVGTSNGYWLFYTLAISAASV